MAATLSAGEQTILFLNRRGFSTVVLCRGCGHVVRCPSCVVSMTYHRGRARLVCHYCGGTAPVPELCPVCGAARLERLGAGTERVEAVMRERYPDARIARLDRDTADGAAPGPGQTGRALDAILGRMQAGEIDILVGTQMVTKGHDFAGVTLVGVLLPDQTMNLPDFRAAERTFQLIEQVAGRAGRGDRPGRVIVQTYTPDHPAIVAVERHDYERFAREELATRRETDYPPFSRMIALRLDARDPARGPGGGGGGRGRGARSGRRRGHGPRPGRGPAVATARPLALAGLAHLARSRRPHRRGPRGRGGGRSRAAICAWPWTSIRRARSRALPPPPAGGIISGCVSLA